MAMKSITLFHKGFNMFLILVNNTVLNFWGNKVGDIFIDNTIKYLRLDPSNVKLLYFPQIWDVPEFYLYSNNSITIQRKVITPTLQPKENDSDPDVFINVESYEDVITNDAEVFFENGMMIKPC